MVALGFQKTRGTMQDGQKVKLKPDGNQAMLDTIIDDGTVMPPVFDIIIFPLPVSVFCLHLGYGCRYRCWLPCNDENRGNIFAARVSSVLRLLVLSKLTFKAALSRFELWLGPLGRAGC